MVADWSARGHAQQLSPELGASNRHISRAYAGHAPRHQRNGRILVLPQQAPKQQGCRRVHNAESQPAIRVTCSGSESGGSRAALRVLGSDHLLRLRIGRTAKGDARLAGARSSVTHRRRTPRSPRRTDARWSRIAVERRLAHRSAKQIGRGARRTRAGTHVLGRPSPAPLAAAHTSNVARRGAQHPHRAGKTPGLLGVLGGALGLRRLNVRGVGAGYRMRGQVVT